MSLSIYTRNMPITAAQLSLCYLALFAIAPNIIVLASSINQPFLRMRNQYLRMYLMFKKKAVKQSFILTKEVLKEKTNTMYQSILSKYNDVNIFYYSLSDEERELIEQVFNLCY